MRRIGRHALRLEGFQELAQEQRVAVRRGVARLGEGRFHAVSQPLADDLGCGRGAERSRNEHACARIARQLGEERVVRPRVRGAQRADREDRDAVEPPGEVGEENAYFPAFEYTAEETGTYLLQVTSFEGVNTGELVVTRD